MKTSIKISRAISLKCLGHSLILVAFTVLGTLSQAASAKDSPKEALKAPAQELARLARVLAPRPSAEQTIFIEILNSEQLEKALFQWPSAFEESAVGATPSGEALGALLNYHNGLRVYALESLLTIEQPEKIHAELRSVWKRTVPENAYEWSLINAKLWRSQWKTVFGQGVESRVRSHEVFQAGQERELQELLKKAPEGTPERVWLEWQSVLISAVAANSDNSAAAKKLAALMSTSQAMKPPPVSMDLMNLTAARLLYQAGYLEAAKKYYERVSKTSDDWFDAQEELAWTELRKGEAQNALAITRSLVIPAFLPLISPEAVFAKSLAHLKVCDYPEVAKALHLFRDTFKERSRVLMALSDSGNTPSVDAFIGRMKANRRLQMTDLGAEAAKLPRFVARDEVLTRAIQLDREFEAESSKFKDLYGRSVTGGTAKVGFQGRLEQVRRELDTRARAARSAVYLRIKALAREELDEISQVLTKMHIVEAELLQQVAMSDRVVKSTEGTAVSEKKGTTGSRDRDRVVFPDDGETWFDEVSNYQVDLKKGCQVGKKQ